MNRTELMTAAQKTILEKQVKVSPFSNLSPPIVQVGRSQKLTNLPIEHKYLGEHRGKHVYNLCAYSILQHLERYREEFEV